MVLLDENIRDSQADLLRKMGIACRKIGNEISVRGVSDADIIPLLLRLKHPTFFTHDDDFWDAALCHTGYSVAFLDVNSRDSAGYIRRFMRHALFNTFNKRRGKVFHIHTREITYFAAASRKAQVAGWLNR